MQNKTENLIQASTTPLASIFGSGFLVIVPILAGAVGEYSILVMACICAIAYLVGSVIRYNIIHAEPVLADNPAKIVYRLERSSDFAIVLAYIISVSLYLNIMSAFVLGGVGMDTEVNEKLLTSFVILLIVIIGLVKGLEILEKLESYALVVTLLIVLILSIGFLSYDEKQLMVYFKFELFHALEHSTWEILTIVAGTLIVVQGFETTRFMGESYDADTRVLASRYSQIIASIVYVVFISLALPIVHTLNGQYDDNSLIKLAGVAYGFLVLPLVVSAALSQFAAAVADTIAASGNMAEASSNKINNKISYLVVGVGSITLTWFANTYEILALASRSFALYYFLQCLLAIRLSQNMLQKIWMVLIAFILLFIIIFAVPAG